MQKLTYYRFQVGKFAILKEDEIHEGKKILAGTLIKILNFPFKVRKGDQDDGYIHRPKKGVETWVVYDRFIHGIDVEGNHVRPSLSKCLRTRKSF